MSIDRHGTSKVSSDKFLFFSPRRLRMSFSFQLTDCWTSFPGQKSSLRTANVNSNNRPNLEKFFHVTHSPREENSNIRAIIFLINYSLLFLVFFLFFLFCFLMKMHAQIFFDLVSDVLSPPVTSTIIFPAMSNQTWPPNLPTFTPNQRVSDKHPWLINRFTIVQRSFFILALVSQFLLGTD